MAKKIETVIEAVEEIADAVQDALSPEDEVEESVEEVEELAEEEVKKISGKKNKEENGAEVVEEKKEKSLEERKKAILEKAKKLKEKVSTEATTEELKEQVKDKKTDMLIPLEDYVKSGIYLGTRVVTPEMRKYVYRRRADGLAIFNTDLIDEKLKEGIVYLSKFAPEEIIVVCKRQAGWKAVEMFSRVTGVRIFAKKYPAGILTNTNLENFFENELTVVSDSWIDKNALNDTLNVKKKVLMICDTNNFPKGANQIVIGNNKSAKSIGLIYYLLARGYCKARGIDTNKIPDMEEWIGEDEEVEAAAKKKVMMERAGAKWGV